MVEFEDTEARVTSEHGVVGFDFRRRAAQAFFGQFGDGSRFADLVAEIRSHLLICRLRVQWLRKLN